MPTLDSYCARTVKLTLGCEIGFVGDFWRVVKAQIFRFFPDFYLRLPAWADLAYAKVSRPAIRARCTLVLKVFRASNVSEVAKPVVAADAVYVVNIPQWMDSVHIEPCEPVRPMHVTGNTDHVVPIAYRYTCLLSPTMQKVASEYASLRIVIKQFAQACCGKIGLSHDVSPVKKLIGQKPARVDSTGGLRYFITLAYSGAMGISDFLSRASAYLAEFFIQEKRFVAHSHLRPSLAFNPYP